MGPVCVRELVTAARRWRTYAERYELAAVLALLAGGIVGLWWYNSPAGLTTRTMSRLTLQIFALAAAAQAVLTMSLVPQAVANGLAGERDKNTLASLLATTLPSRTIVLDVVIAALARHACWLAVTLPVMLVLTNLGGVDPRFVVVSYAALFTLAFALAGLAAAVAAGAPGRKKASQWTGGIAGIWMVWPSILPPLFSRYMPQLWSWLSPINDYARASSPLVIFFDVIAGAPPARLTRDVAWMMGLQAALGVVLIAWAIARLRPASRRLEEREGAASARRAAKVAGSLHRRPPCGDDPMLWKERYTGVPLSWGMVALGLAVLAVFVTIAALLGTYLAAPAFREWWDAGFRSTGDRHMREAFNMALRVCTAVGGFIYVLILTGLAAEGIALERAKDTWTSLLTTPLEGREILRAKRLGAAWRSRFLLLLLAALWLMGVAVGSVSPLGVPAAALAIWAMSAAASAWGTYCSLISKGAPQATNRAVLPVLGMAVSGLLPFLLPAGIRSIVLGAGSLPLVASMSLVAPWEVREALGADWLAWSPLSNLPGDPLLVVVASYLLGIGLWSTLAALARRLGERRFDRAAGRSVAPESLPPRPAPLVVTVAAEGVA